MKRTLYLGLTPSGTSAGDRRRFLYYSKQRKMDLAKASDKNVACVVAAENWDLSMIRPKYPGTPIVYDLIDAYLIRDNFVDDYLRSIAKTSTGQIKPTLLPYSKVVARNCKIADAVVCSSVEQKELILRFNSNVHVILDSHDEFPLMDFRKNRTGPSNIFWEGLPFTLPSIGRYLEAFQRLGSERKAKINFLTDEHYFKYLGRFGRTNTKQQNSSMLQELGCDFSLVKWSLDNVIRFAMESLVGLVPINVESPFQRLKPENRMLIMWRLGLPCLVSSTPSHSRVSLETQLQNTFSDSDSLYAKLVHLIDDFDAQQDNVKRGQAYLADYHNLGVFLSSWDKVLASVV